MWRKVDVFLFMVRETGHSRFAPCLLDHPNALHFGTGLRIKKLKTIINRFLHAFCHLRVQVPSYFIYKKKNTNLKVDVFLFMVRETGLEPVWSPTRTLNVRVCRFRHSRISVAFRDNVDCYNRWFFNCQHIYQIFFKKFFNKRIANKKLCKHYFTR